jgi:hypothetical protein
MELIGVVAPRAARRPVARMRATAGDVIARSSEVRRLLRRRLRIEVTV